jgi:hypothetical protein
MVNVRPVRIADDVRERSGTERREREWREGGKRIF